MAKLIRSMRLHKRLAVIGVIAGCATAGAVAVPALATNEYYECGSCNVVNGPDNYVKNNFTINHSGGGICTYMWEKVNGKYYQMSGSYCVSGGGTAYECQLYEVYGHGEAERLSFGGFLRGRQDNFTKCE